MSNRSYRFFVKRIFRMLIVTVWCLPFVSFSEVQKDTKETIDRSNVSENAQGRNVEGLFIDKSTNGGNELLRLLEEQDASGYVLSDSDRRIEQTANVELVRAVNSADFIFSSSRYLSANPCSYKKNTAPELVLVPRRVLVGDRFEQKPFAIGRCEVTVAELLVFLNDYGRRPDHDFKIDDYECMGSDSQNKVAVPKANSYPADCIDYELAQLYVTWLSEKTGIQYRLPTSSEWRFAANAPEKSFSAWFSGDLQCQYMNGADATLALKNVEAVSSLLGKNENYATCADNHVFTAPVASFRPNNYGLYDMYGNVEEWVDDDVCAALKVGGCAAYTGWLAGGNWNSSPDDFKRSGIQAYSATSMSLKGVGFRVARSIENESLDNIVSIAE